MAKQKYIETPKALWDLFEKYKNEIKSNPILKHVFVGKDGKSEEEKRERPLTMEGFSSWLFENNITSNVHDYFANTRDAYDEYSSICRAIKEIIRKDQIEGGMAGIYNPSITQRLNGLTDKREIKEEKSVKLLNIDPLS